MAVESNIAESDDFFIGEDKSLTWTIYQSDGTTAQDVTGWALSWTVKRREGDLDASAVLTKTTSSGIELTTPASGIVTVTVADTDTDSLHPQTYYHELKRTDAGFETVLTYGRMVLRRALHRT
jgi:hypothetical protein